MFDDVVTSFNLEKVAEAQREQAANFLALALILMEKGIITNEEYRKARVRATSIIDQAAAEKTVQCKKEFAERNPTIQKFMDLFATNSLDGIIDPDDEKKEGT